MCLGGERRGQAGRQQLWRRVGRVWRCARSRAERFLQDALPALLSGATGRRVWSRARGRESGRSEPGTGRALMDWVRRGSCSRPWASVSRPVRGDGRPERSHVLSARTPCAQKPAAGGSLTLAAALYSGKCGGLPERPLRSQVAGGEASGEGGRGCGGEDGRSWLRREPGFSLRTRVVGGEGGWKWWRSGCVGVPRARKAGRGKRSCKRRKQRDRRKRQGWDENSPSRGARERARHAGGGLRVLGSAWKSGG